jgi:hypothetical protein
MFSLELPNCTIANSFHGHSFLMSIAPLPTCFIVFSLQMCKFTFIVLNFMVLQSSSNVVLLLFVIWWGQSCSCFWSYDVQGRATRNKTCFFTIFFKWTCLLLVMVLCLRVCFQYYCLWCSSVFVLTIIQCGLVFALIVCSFEDWKYAQRAKSEVFFSHSKSFTLHVGVFSLFKMSLFTFLFDRYTFWSFDVCACCFCLRSWDLA